MEGIRKDVVAFAEAMETKLKKHDAARGTHGWRAPGCSVAELFDCVESKVEKLEESIADCASVETAEECVNIANFAMMIHPRINLRMKNVDTE